MTLIGLALVGLLLLQHLAHRRERDELRACAEVEPELPDEDEPMVAVWSLRSEALADAANMTPDGGFVVVHGKGCGRPAAACTCRAPEAYRITRGQA